MTNSVFYPLSFRLTPCLVKNHSLVINPCLKTRSIAVFSDKTVNFKIFHEFHQKVTFRDIERTNSVHVVTSDWFVTRFGNDCTFLTRGEQKCRSGHRTGGVLPEKSSKGVTHRGVINGVINHQFCQFWLNQTCLWLGSHHFVCFDTVSHYLLHFENQVAESVKTNTEKC